MQPFKIPSIKFAEFYGEHTYMYICTYIHTAYASIVTARLAPLATPLHLELTFFGCDPVICIPIAVGRLINDSILFDNSLNLFVH